MSLKIRQILYEETYGFDLRWQLARLLMFPFPIYTGSRTRALIMRTLGYQVGRGALILGSPSLTGGQHLHKRLSIGEQAIISVGCFFDLVGHITICDRAGIGPGSMLITGTHQIGSSLRRFGLLEQKPITIGSGVWLSARCTILPGVTVGEGSVVAAGAVVTKDVPPNTLVGGVPAKVIRDLPKDEG